MQSSARKNGLKQGFHGFTLHSYLLCIGRKSFPLLANIYLNEFDQEYQKRGVVFVRYADYTEVKTMPKNYMKYRKYQGFSKKLRHSF